MAQNNLTLILQQLDDEGVIQARRQSLISDVAPSVGDWRGLGNLTTTSLTAITLPVAQVRQVFVKNTHVSAKLTVTWTPTLGASAIVGILGPGDVLAFWGISTGTTYGVSALSLQSNTANTTFELFLGG